jgi:lipoprotein
MTKRNFFAAAVAALLLVLSFSSCSNSNKLLETIPSSARAVARINLMTIGNELGMKLEGDEVVVPADLESVFGKDDKKMGAMLKEVDAENVYVFMMDDSLPFAVFALKSESGFIAAAEKISGKKAETVDGYTVVEDFVIKDGMAWGVDGSATRAVEMVKEALRKAANGSMNDVEAVTDALDGDGLMNFAVQSPAGFVAGGKDEAKTVWTTGKLTAKGNALHLTAKAVNADGSDYKTDYLQDINTSVLQYAPKSSMLVAAMGLTDKIPWSTVSDVFSQIYSLNATQTAQMGMAVSMLQSLDGTVMAAVGPRGGLTAAQALATSADDMDWDFIVMAHLKQDKMDQILGLVNGITAGGGQSVGSSLWKMPVSSDKTVYYGAVDGYLTVASFEPKPDGGVGVQPFEGHDAGLCVDVPDVKAALGRGKDPMGLKIVASGDGNEGEMTLTVENTDKKVLVALLTMF